MSAHSHAPGSTDALRALAEVQLQVQASRSATLDARAIGVMGVDAGLAAIVVGARPLGAFGITALTALSLSAAIAGRSLFLGGDAWIGPSIARLFALRKTYNDRSLDELILRRLVTSVSTNEAALARREPRLIVAFILLAFAALLTLTSGIH